MWQHDKYLGVLFDGDYKLLEGKRVFTLEGYNAYTSKTTRVKYKSWQEAKKNGWKKV